MFPSSPSDNENVATSPTRGLSRPSGIHTPRVVNRSRSGNISHAPQNMMNGRQEDGGLATFRSPRRSIAHNENASPSASQPSVYGGTPLYVRQIRHTRADIGDRGRAHLMEDVDIGRIIDSPTDELIFAIHNHFSAFFDTFIIGDYDGLPVSEEDSEVINMMLRSGQEHGYGHYYWKMVQYIQNQMSHDKVTIDEASSSNRCIASGAFEINLTHMLVFKPHLYQLIINNPADSVCEMDVVIRHKYLEVSHFIEGKSSSKLPINVIDSPKVRFFNKPDHDSPRTLDPTHIDALVGIHGIVLRCSDLIPEISMAAFRCTGRTRVGVETFIPCENEVYEQVVEGEVLEPVECPACGGRKTFELWHNMCHFSSKQLVKISELAENIPLSEAPQTIAVYAYDDLIDAAQPGDRVEIVGIFKASGVRLNPNLRNLNAVFRTYVDALHIRKDSRHRIRASASDTHGKGILKRGEDGLLDDETEAPLDISLSTEVIEKIKALASDPNIYQKLVNSLAPSIYGRENEKKGLLCQMFGGSRLQGKKFGNFRSEIHILLCGDPSTAKSQLLQYVHKLSPRGIYASGKGSSGVGLTVAVTRDPDSKEFVLESGAVVLSDRGTCCIDEFDKMDESARAVLHEVMEQQTVTIAKAGIVATLNARTAILASANPVHSRYDRRRAVVENINLPPSLFSRFDLIYLVLDTADEKEDRQLARMLCSSFSGIANAVKEDQAKERPISPSLLAQFISYARATCNPKLSVAASNVLKDEYCKMRYQDGQASRAPTASPRQLEALIRISQALAKMRLAHLVTADDALEAVRLMKVATYQSLIDPSTGRIDFDQVHIGQTLRERLLLEQLKENIQQILANASLTRDQIFAKMQDILTNSENNAGNGRVRSDPRQLEECLNTLEKDQIILQNNTGEYRLFRSAN